MTPEHDAQTMPASVETAWVETLQAELQIDADEGAVRKYPNFLFGNPLFTMGDVDPDTAVVLVDRLLDRYRPEAFFDVEGALTAEEWVTLKEDLVGYLAEGVDGERPGPASAFPDAPVVEDDHATAGVESPGAPETTESPAGTDGRAGAVSDLGVGLADEGFDDDELTMAGLYDNVSAVVAESDLDSESVRMALERVIEEAEAKDDTGDDS
jgi:hypothetical protein